MVGGKGSVAVLGLVVLGVKVTDRVRGRAPRGDVSVRRSPSFSRSKQLAYASTSVWPRVLLNLRGPRSMSNRVPA